MGPSPATKDKGPPEETAPEDEGPPEEMMIRPRRKSPRTRKKEAKATREAAIEEEFQKSARRQLNQNPKNKTNEKGTNKTNEKGTNKTNEKSKKNVVSTSTNQNDEGTTAAAPIDERTAAADSDEKKRKNKNPQVSTNTTNKSSKGAAKVAKLVKKTVARRVVTRRNPAPPEEEEEQTSDDDKSSVAEIVLVRTVGTKHNPTPRVKEEEEEERNSAANHSPDPPRYVNREDVDDDEEYETSYHTADHSSSDDDDDILVDNENEEAVVDCDREDLSTSSNEEYERPRGRRDNECTTGHTASKIPTVAIVAKAPTSAAASTLGLDGETLHIRGMSRSQSILNRQKHVTDRVRVFVKSDIFRKIKFINSDASFQQAIRLVMDHENVPEQQRGHFQMLYESVFNEALNTKRSSCEQSGGKIVRETIAKFKLTGEELFTMDELCKLRRATTERELQAFYWFFGTYLECVCGRRYWGKQKTRQLISEAREPGGRGRIVTKSDEAFALLMFENYIDKWKSLPPVDDEAEDSDSEQGQRKKKAKPRQRGAYTATKSGHCKYGGWSHEGIARFNELYSLVQEDRQCTQAEAMEKQLLAFCMGQAGLVHGRDARGGEQDNDTAVPAAMTATFVEAAWDLDD